MKKIAIFNRALEIMTALMVIMIIIFINTIITEQPHSEQQIKPLMQLLFTEAIFMIACTAIAGILFLICEWQDYHKLSISDILLAVLAFCGIVAFLAIGIAMTAVHNEVYLGIAEPAIAFGTFVMFLAAFIICNVY